MLKFLLAAIVISFLTGCSSSIPDLVYTSISEKTIVGMRPLRKNAHDSFRDKTQGNNYYVFKFPDLSSSINDAYNENRPYNYAFEKTKDKDSCSYNVKISASITSDTKDNVNYYSTIEFLEKGEGIVSDIVNVSDLHKKVTINPWSEINSQKVYYVRYVRKGYSRKYPLKYVGGIPIKTDDWVLEFEHVYTLYASGSSYESVKRELCGSAGPYQY
jgi:hypothetical protein